jgi:glycosyltransferase involved in cell wall biosynthesis
MPRRRILHVITDLGCGGAEMMLVKLLHGLDRDAFECEVVSMTDAGELGPRIEALGLPVHALDMRAGVPDPRGLVRLAQRLRQRPPDLVHAWMVHADLLAGIAARMAGGLPVVWELQQGPPVAFAGSLVARWLTRCCARLAPCLALRTIFCDEAGCEAHARLGFPARGLVVIPNGIDVAQFHPDAGARAGVRRELAIPATAPLVGLFARVDPQKDHRTFLEAAGRVGATRSDVHFVLCGKDVNAETLGDPLDRTGIAARMHLLGRRDDMPRLAAAIDLLVLSSVAEGCPNVLGEAMACGVPAVVTQAGDCAAIVGDTGRVVPPSDPAALACAMLEMLALDADARCALGVRARERIVQHYALQQAVARYSALYADLLPAP